VKAQAVKIRAEAVAFRPTQAGTLLKEILIHGEPLENCAAALEFISASDKYRQLDIIPTSFFFLLGKM
jgi:hypothetical protein